EASMDLMIEARVVRFGGFRLDTVTRQLTAPDGSDLTLAGRAYDVLAMLIRNRPRVVGRDEILAEVWAGRVVEENNLTQAISQLRRVFRNQGRGSDPILTVPGRGYSFVAEIEELDASAMPESAPPVPDRVQPERPAVARPRRRPWATLAALLAMSLTGAVLWMWPAPDLTPGPGATSEPVPLAVLPFRASESEDAQRALGIGIAETVIARLSRSDGLRVLSLGSTQAMTAPDTDPLQAGIALGARYVVAGEFQRIGKRTRVSARLLQVSDGHSVWEDNFNLEPHRILAVQAPIAEGVASALSVSYPATTYRSACDGDDPQAHAAYLRGLYLVNRPNPRTVEAAAAAFGTALQRDPGCAKAWAGLAQLHRAKVMVADADPELEFPRSDAAIAKALALDPDSAEAYAARGFNQFWYHWDWPAAEASLERAIQLNPNEPFAHFVLAHLLNNTGQHQRALVQARIAVELDPLSPIVNTLVSWFEDAAGQRQRSAMRLDRALELEPDFWVALQSRAMRELAAGDKENAKRLALRSVQLTERSTRSLVYLAIVHARSQRPDEIRKLLDEMHERASADYVLPSTMALLHVMLGEKQQALDLLEEGYAHHDIGMAFLSVWFADLAGEPRFDALLQAMHLPSPVADRSTVL
ncbi:MAG TPA: winged helix-turn-helix domain-containing protein, partial [Rhodanobacteraceae bacterium]|nr:winged helix-turn-helix domain-containing protein [Rhodanobacteraceae bacterium]